MGENRDQWGETEEERSDRILARDLARLTYFDERAKDGVPGRPSDDLAFNAGYAAGLSMRTDPTS